MQHAVHPCEMVLPCTVGFHGFCILVNWIVTKLQLQSSIAGASYRVSVKWHARHVQNTVASLSSNVRYPIFAIGFSWCFSFPQSCASMSMSASSCIPLTSCDTCDCMIVMACNGCMAVLFKYIPFCPYVVFEFWSMPARGTTNSILLQSKLQTVQMFCQTKQISQQCNLQHTPDMDFLAASLGKDLKRPFLRKKLFCFFWSKEGKNWRLDIKVLYPCISWNITYFILFDYIMYYNTWVAWVPIKL